MACTRSLTSAGYRVFGSVRTQSDAARLSAEFGDAFTPIMFDVTDAAAVATGAAEIRRELGGQRLAGLVCNAGIGTTAPIALVPLAEIRRLLEVNVLGSVSVIQQLLPLLGMDPSLAGPPGRIAVVSSVAGKLALPFAGPYAASKHALEAIADSLRAELLPTGIDVVIVAPGVVKTPIWDKSAAQDLSGYAGTVYEAPIRAHKAFLAQMAEHSALTAEDVAEVVQSVLFAPRPRTRYAPVAGKVRNWMVPRLLPRRFLERTLGRRLGLLPKV